jgi:hypothetical protein
VLLFASAGFFVLVMLGTLLAGKRIPKEPLMWAEPLEVPAGGFHSTAWDRLGVWFVVAVVLAAIAYVGPLHDILQLERFGSPGFKPF